MDFRIALDTMPRARLMQWLEALGVPTHMQWESMHSMNPCQEKCGPLGHHTKIGVYIECHADHIANMDLLMREPMGGPIPCSRMHPIP